MVATQVPQLGPRLDAFGDYFQVEAVTHLDDRHDDGVVVWAVVISRVKLMSILSLSTGNRRR